MPSSFPIPAAIALVAILSTNASAFSPPKRQPFMSASSRLFYEGQGFNEESSSSDDNVEQARKQLEGIFQDETFSSPEHGGKIHVRKLVAILTDPANSNRLESLLPPPPPLTSAERDRRMMELKLLEQLASSDDAAEQLLHLWASEKGHQALERLQQAEEFLSAGQVIASEQMLLRLIDDYGVYHWVEPLNRLATVYFKQGRFQEAYHLCKALIRLKPWHVGTLEGIVEVCVRLGERDKARDWAARGLPKLISSTSFPPFSSSGPANPQRAVWVHEAIQQAQEALSHLEYQTKCDFLGNPEEYYSVGLQVSNDGENEEQTTCKEEPQNTEMLGEYIQQQQQQQTTSATMDDKQDDDAWQ